MCGIFGLINKDGSDVDRDLVYSATEKLKHRGPDGEGFYFHQNIGLGHRRLSIIDLSDKGKQPMEKHGMVISYNGEIYNYMQLRNELISLGYKFSSSTDTEVILSAIDCWGPKAVEKFSGMWAFLILDIRSNEILVSRDHWGMKPLFIYESTSTLSFSSEIKSFTTLPSWTGNLNAASVYDFIARGELYHSHATFFQDVSAFPMGVIRKYDHHGKVLETISYDFLSKEKLDSYYDDGSFVKLFSESVNKHFVSDVPVACALSGGLDSSSIVMEAHEQNLLLDTFSFSPSEIEYSEYEYVEELQKELKFSNFQVSPSFKEHIEAHLDALKANEAPALNMNLISSYLLYEKVADHDYKVLLAGQGADELLLGYHFYFLPYLKFCRRKSFPKFVKLLLSLAFRYPTKWGALFTNKNITVAPYFLKEVPQTTKPQLTFPEFYLSMLGFGHLHRLLVFEDHLSMAHGVEARLPFLDQAFSNHAMSLDFSEHLRGVKTKWMLRKAMKDRLPDSIIGRRDKMGFVSPQASWVYENSAFFMDEVNVAMQKYPGWLDSNILPYLSNLLENGEGHDMVWRVFSFYKFLDLEL